MMWYGFAPGWQILTLPAFVVMAFLASLGPGLWVSALNIRFRDFRYVVPFIVQFGLYVSPVGFSSSVVAPEWRLLYNLNPIVGVIDGFRRSEEHTSELQSLMRNSYAVFCLKKKKKRKRQHTNIQIRRITKIVYTKIK